MKRSPLYEVHQTLYATFTSVAGWELPQRFEDPQAEYQALRHGVGLCDLSHLGLVRITGKDRQRFLHAMVSNDTQSLQPGQGCYATFLNVKGHLVADFRVYAEPEAYLLEMEPQVVRTFVETLDTFIISEDVVLHDESGIWGCLALQGPQATELLTLALGQAMPTLAPYASVAAALAGHAIRCIQRSYTGEPGYILLTPAAALLDVWQALWAHREACDARAVGLEMLDVARIEAGMPVYGRDMSEETLPLEANLDAAISYTKGCYIGQEVVARIESRGHVNRKLVGLLLQGDALPASGATIISPQREVGWITSAAYSPARQQNIALGYVRREALTPGTSLEVQIQGQPLSATVAALPFYPPAPA
jgi:glycine cleavage system T protein